MKVSWDTLIKLMIAVGLVMVLHFIEVQSAFAQAQLPPVADAGGPYAGQVGQSIPLEGSNSYDPDGTIVLYEWDFDNDGTYDVSEITPTTNYTWIDPGMRTIVLRVTDAAGLQDTDTAEITVNETTIPTLSEWSALLLALLLATSTCVVFRRHPQKMRRM